MSSSGYRSPGTIGKDGSGQLAISESTRRTRTFPRKIATKVDRVGGTGAERSLEMYENSIVTRVPHDPPDGRPVGEIFKSSGQLLQGQDETKLLEEFPFLLRISAHTRLVPANRKSQSQPQPPINIDALEIDLSTGPMALFAS